ncbi:Membrane-bound lytic murein transglycosylase F [Ephemeroptericola cinctiostellae]|uniref:Membrane-bound lytic murein transglycosylase F n=1 Tax=Ephemeroptericola cinctiostellae TaxID=2268024 RepID=A0A345DDJ1_9BURK|nr:transglycosylase SLT domain-containing protein [Ephemeroptericola cinctiostellae]AXF86429.1 Membrane-bound lytic murein transglycosylase F [Ephemeroptericola cinctiostellae]
MRTATHLFAEVRAVVLACALMAALNFAGCTPTPVETATVAQPTSQPANITPVSESVEPAESALVNDAVVLSADVLPTQAVQAQLPETPITAVTPEVTESLVAKSANEPHPRAGPYKHVLIQQSRNVWGLGAPVASFAAQIHQESRWNATAHSPVGAVGLTQFMPATARWIGTYDTQLAPVDVYNPRWAMRALAVYDKFLYDKVAGINPCERLAFAMSAYNGGLGWVNKRKARSSTPNVCFGETCDINPGITASNQRENANYPKLILKQFEPMYVRAGWGVGACHAR